MSPYVWSGMLSFGLVTIPVHLQAAVSSSPATLTMLHATDAAPLERRMVCPRHDEVVEREEQLRGFEVAEGSYVTVTEQELESLAAEQSQAIEIQEFVELRQIDPLYFDRPYFLVPDRGAEKPYRLLVRALRETDRAGIAKFVMREREHLVAVWVLQDALCLTTLHFARQVASTEGLAPKKTRVPSDALDKLKRHIEKTTREFVADSYDDEDSLRLMRLVKRRAGKDGVEKSPAAQRRRRISGKRLTRRLNRTMRRIKTS